MPAATRSRSCPKAAQSMAHGTRARARRACTHRLLAGPTPTTPTRPARPTPIERTARHDRRATKLQAAKAHLRPRRELGRDDSDPTAYFVVETPEDLAKVQAAIMARAPDAPSIDPGRLRAAVDRDPLDQLRASLGPRLAAQLRDTGAQPAMRDLATEQLRAIVDQHQGAAVDAFPAAEALELRRSACSTTARSPPRDATAPHATPPRCNASTTASAASSTTNAPRSSSASRCAATEPTPRSATSTAPRTSKRRSPPANATPAHGSPVTDITRSSGPKPGENSPSAASMSCATLSSKRAPRPRRTSATSSASGPLTAPNVCAMRKARRRPRGMAPAPRSRR